MTVALQETLWDGSQFVGKLQDKLIHMLERSEAAQRDQMEAILLYYLHFEGLDEVMAKVIRTGNAKHFRHWFLHEATSTERVARELRFVQRELRPDLLPDDIKEERDKKQAQVRGARKAAKRNAR